MDHVIESDAAEGLSEFLLGGRENRKHDLRDELRVRLLSGVDCADGAQNIVCRHPTAFARKFITAMRAPVGLEDAFAHQRLKDRIEMARG